MSAQNKQVDANGEYTDVVLLGTDGFTLKDATRVRRSFPQARIHLLRNFSAEPCDDGFYNHGYTVAQISDKEVGLTIDYKGLSSWTSSGLYKYQQHYVNKKNGEARRNAVEHTALSDHAEPAIHRGC